MKTFFLYLERNVVDFSTIREMLIHLIYDVIIPISLQLDFILMIDKTLQRQPSYFLYFLILLLYTLHFLRIFFSCCLESSFQDDDKCISLLDHRSRLEFSIRQNFNVCSSCGRRGGRGANLD